MSSGSLDTTAPDEGCLTRSEDILLAIVMGLGREWPNAQSCTCGVCVVLAVGLGRVNACAASVSVHLFVDRSVLEVGYGDIMPTHNVERIYTVS